MFGLGLRMLGPWTPFLILFYLTQLPTTTTASECCEMKLTYDEAGHISEMFVLLGTAQGNSVACEDGCVFVRWAISHFDWYGHQSGHMDNRCEGPSLRVVYLNKPNISINQIFHKTYIRIDQLFFSYPAIFILSFNKSGSVTLTSLSIAFKPDKDHHSPSVMFILNQMPVQQQQQQ